MRILAIIPARGGSKGVQGKNVKVLGSQPLIAYSLKQAQQSQWLTKIIVSTDDATIANVAKEHGAEIPFLRPSELASDTATSISVVQHAIVFFEAQNEFFDAVCLLQPTTPFREPGFIDKAIETFAATDCDALISVLPVPHEYNPHWTFEPNGQGLLQIATGENEIIARRQDLPKSYFRDGAIYLTKVATLKKGSFYGDKLGYIESNPEWYVNIDTMEDWIKAEAMLPNLSPLF